MQKYSFFVLVLVAFIAACGNVDNGRLNNIADNQNNDKYFAENDVLSKKKVYTQVNPKIDPHLNLGQIIKSQSNLALKDVNNGENLEIRIFIKSQNPQVTKDNILNLGGEIGSLVGQIITAAVTADMIDTIADWPEVIYIEKSQKIAPQNDTSMIDTGVNVIHEGPYYLGEAYDVSSFEQGYTGTGVIVGVIDSGLDLTHPAFFDQDNNSRVLYVWDQQDDSGVGPVEIESTYGTECNNDEINNGECDSTDSNGHGTHVTGIAAGKDDIYGGVAPISGIIMVKYKSPSLEEEKQGITFATTVCDAANYIFKKADFLGMPAVINISLGTANGPHDGTSLFEQCLDTLISESPGRFIVVSAGNSAKHDGGGTHISYLLELGEAKGSFWQPLAYRPIYQLELWDSKLCDMDISVGLWNGEMNFISDTGFIESGIWTAGTFGDVMGVAIDRTETDNPLNNKRHTYIYFVPLEDYDPQNHYFDIVFWGECDDFHAWVNSDYDQKFSGFSGLEGGVEYISGDNKNTIMIPSTAKNVLSVGSYNRRTEWTDFLGNPQNDPMNVGSIGDISSFSSRGPALTEAQGQKPNLAAPGAWIISALSADANPSDSNIINNEFQIMPGTSMASPHVTGIVALMLQANPDLTYDKILDTLQSTARADNTSVGSKDYVGDAPNDDWGYGKVDAYEAVKAVAPVYAPEPEPGPTPDTDTDADTSTSSDNTSSSGSSGSGGGCSLLKSNNASVINILILLSVLVMFLTVRKRISKT